MNPVYPKLPHTLLGFNCYVVKLLLGVLLALYALVNGVLIMTLKVSNLLEVLRVTLLPELKRLSPFSIPIHPPLHDVVAIAVEVAGPNLSKSLQSGSEDFYLGLLFLPSACDSSTSELDATLAY